MNEQQLRSLLTRRGYEPEAVEDIIDTVADEQYEQRRDDDRPHYQPTTENAA